MPTTDPASDPLAPLIGLPGVRDAVDAATAKVDVLLGNRVLRRRSADVSTESLLRGAWASAVLAGSTAGLEDVRAGDTADPLVRGALRAYGAIGELTGAWARAPRQAMARLHTLAAADLVADDALGRPTSGAQRLDTLAGTLAATHAPAAVVAGVVHAELVTLDAFAPVSPIVASAAVRLVLIGRGLDPKSLVVVEAGHRDLADDRTAALDAYRSGSSDGLARWLRHQAAAIGVGAIEAAAICQALQRG